MVSSPDACASPTSHTYGTSIPITINPQQAITRQLNTPTNPVCSTNATNVTFVATTGNVPSGTTFQYQWIINGSPQTPTSSNTYNFPTLANGTTVSVNITALTGCVSNPTGTPPGMPFVASVTTAVSPPSLSINPNKTTFCSPESGTFTASVSTGSSYVWKLSTSTLTTPTPAYQLPIIVTNDGGTANALSPGDNLTVDVTLTGCYTNNLISASYSASALTIQSKVTPSINLASIPNPFCNSSALVLSATGAVNQGTSPTYRFNLDGTWYSTGTTASHNAGILSAGSHTAYVEMTSNYNCLTTAVVTSAQQTFSVTAAQTITRQLNAPTNPICSTNATNVPFVATAGNVPGGTTFQYQWIINGSPQSPTSSNTYNFPTLVNGNSVSVNITALTGCVSNPTGTPPGMPFVANVTTAVSPPSLTINPNKTTFCSPESGTFTASVSTGSSYTWKLSTVALTTPTPAYQLPIIVTNDGGTANAMSPGDNLTVDVTLTGCYTSNLISASYSASALTIQSKVTPVVNLAAIANPFCNSTALVLSAAGMLNGGTSPTYRFNVDGTWYSTGTTASHNAGTLSAGTHTAYVEMTSNYSCLTTTIATSTTQTFTVNAPATITRQLNVPTNPICVTSAQHVEFHATTGNVPAGTTFQYQWIVDGAPQTPSSNSLLAFDPLPNGKSVQVNIIATGCVANLTGTVPASAFVANIVNPSSPSGAIAISPLSYCAGATATFTSSSPQSGGSSGYIWKLNGGTVQSIPGQPNKLELPTGLNYAPGVYTTGSTVTAEITNLVGTCLSSTTITATAPALTINAPQPQPSAYDLHNYQTEVIKCDNSFGPVTLSTNSGYVNQWEYSTTDATGPFANWGQAGAQTSSTGTFPSPYVIVWVRARLSYGSCFNYSSVVKYTKGAAPTTPSVPVSVGGTLVCMDTNTGVTTSAPGSTHYTWTVTGFDPVVTTAGTLPFFPSSKGTKTVTVVASNYCGSSASSSPLTLNVVSSTEAAGVTKSVVSGTSRHSVCNGVYGNTTIENPIGTVTRWEYSTTGSSGAWTNWGQAGQTTTSSALPAFANSIWVRAVMTTACGPIATTATQYSKEKDKNYYRLHVPEAVYNTEDAVLLAAETPGNVLSSTLFLDGLGRERQQVLRFGSATENDIVSFKEYDKFGRSTANYLPYATTSSPQCETFKTNDKASQLTFYSPSSPFPDLPVDNSPFAVSKFESSPLNRVLKLGASGSNWQPNTDNYSTGDNTIKVRQELNLPDEVLIWRYNSNGLISAKNAIGQLQYLSAGELVVQRVFSEENKISLKYTDKAGRLLLKRVQIGDSSPINDVNYASTYYVYDDRNLLRTVISPEASTRLTAEYHNATSVNQETFLSNWAFRYKYDERGRVVQKKSPGADWFYIVYDNRDRPVMTQDGNQRIIRQWSYAKYDDLNRPVIAGHYIHATSISQSEMAGLITTGNESYNDVAASYGYTNTVFPIASTSVLTVAYYDNYKFKSLQGAVNTSRFEFKHNHLSGQDIEYLRSLKGMVTGIYSFVQDDGIYLGSTQTALWQVNYYDEKYRPIQVISENYKGGVDRKTTTYEFSGKVFKSKTTHMEGLTWVGKENAEIYGNRVYRTIISGAWVSGVASSEMLQAGMDGWFEFRATPNLQAIVGFGLSNPNTNWNTTRYGLYLQGSGTVQYVENGQITTHLTATFAANDFFRIERSGSQVKVYKNGVVILTRPMLTIAYLVDISLGSVNAQIVGFKTSFGVETSVEKTFDYDHVGRMTKIWNKVNEGDLVLTNQNGYNEIGSLVANKLHSENGADFEQVVDFRYNIRGWLLRINSADLGQNPDAGPRDYFGEEISFDQSIGTGDADYHVNGNVSGVKWSKNLGLEGGGQAAYEFKYDNLNRLTDANYMEKNTVWTPMNSFNEKGITYDLNGNIQTLSRRGKDEVAVDNLVYSHGVGTGRSNKLLSVSDGDDDNAGFTEVSNNSGSDFVYDMNGNLVWDQNKGGVESIVNGNFDSGSANWTLTGTTSRVTFSSGAANVAYSPGSGSVVVKQVGIVEPGKVYVVVLDIQRTSAAGNVNINVGSSTAVNQSATGVYTWTTTGGGNPKDLVITINDSWGGKINSISVKGLMAVAYNHMNLPKTITTAGVGTIATVYDAMGRKICQEAYSPLFVVQKRVDYEGDFVYENGNLSYILHETGRVMPAGGANDWEYQYHLRDHLGNVRVTFTTKESSEEATATMENSNATTEQGQFLHHAEAVRVNSQFFDHTNQGGTYYSTRLSGATNEKFGLAKSLSVMPGDVINVEVFAKYLDPVASNWETALASLMNAIAQGTAPPGTFVDGGLAGSTGSSIALHTALLDRSGETGTAPKAYLNWLLFDGNYNFLDGGYLRVNESAKENGNDGPHQELSRQIQVTQAGYVYVYLSNENETPVEVYFDDFFVEHVKSPIIQINEYYPFGLNAASWTREDAVPNSFLFNQGSELNSSIGWYETYFRRYDASIGRFMQIDPLAEQFASHTPYNFAYNDPLFWNDPSGAINTTDWVNPGFNSKVWDMIRLVAEHTAEGDNYAWVNGDGGGAGDYLGFKIPNEVLQGYPTSQELKDMFGDSFTRYIAGLKQVILDNGWRGKPGQEKVFKEVYKTGYSDKLEPMLKNPNDYPWKIDLLRVNVGTGKTSFESTFNPYGFVDTQFDYGETGINDVPNYNHQAIWITKIDIGGGDTYTIAWTFTLLIPR
jgi:RHS repeat-associated protein